MSREEMIRLARHCNLGLLVGPLYALLDDEWERLHRFAALVAAAERESCAKVCEDEAAEFRSQKEGCRDARYDWKKDAAMECSLAIRARGEVKP